jgi:hypothetical protein
VSVHTPTPTEPDPDPRLKPASRPRPKPPTPTPDNPDTGGKSVPPTPDNPSNSAIPDPTRSAGLTIVSRETLGEGGRERGEVVLQLVFRRVLLRVLQRVSLQSVSVLFMFLGRCLWGLCVG